MSTHNTDMYIYSKTLFKLIRISGLLPVSVSSLPLTGKIARNSRLQMLYTTFILIFYIITSIARAWTVFGNLRSASVFWVNLYTKISIITACVSLLSTALCVIVCLWLAVFKVEEKIALLERFREIHFQLHKKEPYKTRFVSYLTIIHVLFCILCSSIFIFDIISFDTVAQLCKVTITCALVEFLELVLSVRDVFRLVNRRILEVVRLDQRKRSANVWIYALPCVEVTAVHHQESLSIQSLNEVHWRICSIVHDLSDTYGPYLFIMVVYLFAHLIFNPYNLFLQYYTSHSPNNPAMLVTATWILLYFCQLYLLLVPCSLTVSEAKRSTALVSRLMTQVDGKLHQQLDTFAQQLLYREVEFSASGLFSLQTPVVISVTSAVTTYLAIIIQFHHFHIHTADEDIHSHPHNYIDIP